MKHTAMQYLKADLIETIEVSNESLEDLENKELAQEINFYVEAILRMIIQRIDDELLEMEKQQIIDARKGSPMFSDDYEKEAEQYYNETYKK